MGARTVAGLGCQDQAKLPFQRVARMSSASSGFSSREQPERVFLQPSGPFVSCSAIAAFLGSNCLFVSRDQGIRGSVRRASRRVRQAAAMAALLILAKLGKHCR